ncbi:MAG: DMT family transporter [Selenomonadaceae bacterium]|nr:DMT family transporter [Selenomonadaceae bacterium]
MLLGAAFFWGTTFVAQLTGMDGLGPFSYAAGRYLIGFLSLVVLLIFTRKSRTIERRKKNYQRGFLIGLIIGVVLFIATSMQQIALQYSTAGKAAFITCLYIVFVPLGAKLLGKIIRRENWLGAGLAIVGLYLLAVGGNFSIQLGDAILFVSAFVWTAHILMTDKFASKVDVIEMSAAQIFVTLILTSIAMFEFETPSLSAMFGAWFPILYAGVMSSGVAFTLQIYGQRYTEPSTAAILMSFEAIFGALAGWFFLGEVMSSREIFGCVLMLIGMLATQWTLIKKSL